MSASLSIAILHYHLRGGGVTRVIDAAAAALAPGGMRFCVLTGEAPDGEPLSQSNLPVRAVEGLGYAGEEDAVPDPGHLLARVREEAAAALGGPPDLWHIHNHSLGKNLATPLLVRQLAESGERLLLQPHDFAEDGRPDRYAFLLRGLGRGDAARLGRILYPAGPHIHYAALNGRDRGFLSAAGVADDTLHLLGNPAGIPGGEDALPEGLLRDDEKLVLYPTRAIRRKNLGEFLFWAAACRDGGMRFATTLAPKNPQHRPVYEAWVALARELDLDVDFEIGERWDVPFGTLMRAACRHATTSVGEGFGLAFLEPWLAGRPVVGRNLPEVTDEFREGGIDLSSLYNRLEIPLGWINAEDFRARLADGLCRSLTSYGRKMRDADLQAAWDAAVRGGRVDFGRLDETLQQGAIRRLARDPAAAGEISPGTREFLAAGPHAVEKNPAAVRKQYAPDEYAHRLARAYRAVAGSDSGAVDALDGGRILEGFLAPDRFMLLRT